MANGVAFRFDAAQHEYIDLTTGQVLPHVTGMLLKVGLTSEQWYTKAACDRGSAVHQLTAAYDLGALEDVAGCTSAYKGWLLAHVKAMSILRPAIEAVEEPLVHPQDRFGGRPDRVVTLNGVRGVLEIKSGAPERAHPVQMALQAELVAVGTGLPAHALGRWCLYLQKTGRFRLEEFRDRRDFDAARAIIQQCCR